MKTFIIFLFFIFISVTAAQNDPNCGIKGPKQNLKISGGKEAVPYEFPWMALIGYIEESEDHPEEKSYKPFCGASIIHPQFVLTAAHCQMDNFAQLSVSAAVHNVSLQADEPNRVRVPIEQIFKHPNFTELSLFQYIYDVALVKLATPLDIAGNPHLGTICLPPQNDTWNPYQGRLTTVAGWGWTKPLDETSWSEVLLKVAIPVADMEWCKKMSHLEEKGINSKICTYQEHKAVCMHDFGSPLMLQGDNDNDGRWTAVGVASSGGNCGHKDAPNYYAHVSLVSDWIWKTVKENSGFNNSFGKINKKHKL